MARSELHAEVCRLRGLKISVNDISRETGFSIFEIYEITEGRKIAIKKMARLHYLRGSATPWDLVDGDVDHPMMPTGDLALDASRGIVDLLRGTSLDDDLRKLIDTISFDDRKQLVEIASEIIRIAGRG